MARHPNAGGSLLALDDNALVRAVAVGDRAAFEVLYRRYYRRLYGFLLRWLKDEQTIEEVIDDVLMVVWRDAGKFAERSRVSTWIFGIGWRQALRAVERRVETVSLEEAEEPAEEPAHGLNGELRGQIDRALARLSPEQRMVVELTYFEECCYAEIAAIAECPVNTVKTRMFHARQRLRQLLPLFGWTP
jgi:RNA polymerase sigma factor (sigma-70 family)